ncbi:hypothetical protein L1049_021031 [Liquidambar formosana]|uniref:CWZF3/5/7 THD domain-containing protein n=1 Tax=Liquidambar formosana TaxID=63359 RepID=A0AAP0X7X2_LIQFO
MERVNNKHFCFDESLPPKSGKGSSSQSKERLLTSKSGSDRGRVKISGLYNEQEEAGSLKCEVQKESHYSETYEEEMQDGKSRSQGNHGLKSYKVEKNCVGNNVPIGKHPSGSSSRENQSKFKGQKGPYRKSTAQNCQKDKRPSAPQNLQQNGESNRSSKWLPSDRTNQVEVASGRGESQIISCFGEKERTLSWCSHPVSKSEGGGGSDALPVDGSDGSDAANASKQLGKVDGMNGHHHVIVRHPTPNWNGARDIEAPIPIKREFSTLAANNALREAKDLKNSANRLKISGSGLESTELFFQAALKFLHGASLLEPCNGETARYGELPSMEVYSSTAKLCEYCAHEYERCKDMASATLAYKCMEVAYMQLIYSNDLIASRDRHELQMSLQMVPPVESPSSSASDVDNLNNQATVSEMDMVKDVSSPQVTGIHVISARNRPNFLRLLNFAQAVNLAMEAFRKSQDAFAAACVILAGGGNEEGISSIKRVLDFSFHDLEGLLHLVHLAMESVGN